VYELLGTGVAGVEVWKTVEKKIMMKKTEDENRASVGFGEVVASSSKVWLNVAVDSWVCCWPML
jgi:hypothetical protein